MRQGFCRLFVQAVVVSIHFGALWSHRMRNLEPSMYGHSQPTAHTTPGPSISVTVLFFSAGRRLLLR